MSSPLGFFMPGTPVPGIAASHVDPSQPIPPPAIIPAQLDTAQQVAAQLLSKAKDSIVSDVANGAVAADVLAGRTVAPIQQGLGKAGQALLGLMSPIQTAIVGQLGSAMERALPLGANMPTPDGACVPPASVAIAQDAAVGSIEAAVDAYRTYACPYYQTRPTEYQNQVECIVSAIGQDQRLIDAFYSAIHNICQTGGVYVPPPPKPPFDLQGCLTAAFNFLVQQANQIAPLSQTDPDAYQASQQSNYDTYAANVSACYQQAGLPMPPDALAGLPSIYLPAAVTGSGATGVITPPSTIVGPVTGGGVSPAVLPQGTGSVPSPAGPGLPSGGPGHGPIGTPPAPSPPGVCPPGWTTVDLGGGNYECFPPAHGPDIPTIGPIMPGINVPYIPPRPIPQPKPPSKPNNTLDTLAAADSTPQSGGAKPSIAYAVPPNAPPIGTPFFIGPTGPVASVPPTLPSTPIGGIPKCPPGTTAVQDSSGMWTCVPSTPPTTGPGSGPITVPPGCAPLPTPPGPPSPTSCPPGYTPIAQTPPGIAVGTIGVGAVTASAAFQARPEPGDEVEDEDIQGCDEFDQAPGIHLDGGTADWSVLLGLRDEKGNLNVPFPDAGIADVGKNIANSIVSSITGIVDQVCKGLSQVFANTGCGGGQQQALIAVAALTQFAERFVGDATKIISTPNRQQRNYLCPVDLPSAVDAATAWLGNTISEATLECWVRAAGVRYPEFKRVIDATRIKFPLMQIGSLWLRGIIDDDTLADRIRETGMTADGDVSDLKELLKQIPPPSDLVRMMVRDAGDDALVERFGMDTDFTLKFNDAIKDWAKQSGVEEKYMQYVWRSHWSIPSPGQLFDMLHRSAGLPADDPAAVTLDDVETALQQQDILPFWIPKLLNIAYNPLGRIDARRAYATGVLDKTALYKTFTDIGYNQANAQILVDYTDRQTLLAYLRSPIVRRFSQGLMSDQSFVGQMQQQGASDRMIQYARDRAIGLASEAKNQSCIKALRKRYMLAEIDTDELRSGLAGLGIPSDMVESLVGGAQCERVNRGKELPAGTLAGLYASGTIDAASYASRLQKLGYSYEDSVLLVRRAVQLNQARVSKAEAAALAKQEAADLRQQKQIQRDEVRAAQALAKRQRGILSMQQINTLREKRLLEAGKTWSNSTGGDFGSAVLFIKSLYRNVLSNNFYLPDEVIAAIVAVAGTKEITAESDFVSAVMTALQGADSSAIQMSAPLG